VTAFPCLTGPAELGRRAVALDVGVRDETLWRMLYETAACAEEILTLDVPDLEPNDRCRLVA
jgi:integrase